MIQIKFQEVQIFRKIITLQIVQIFSRIQEEIGSSFLFLSPIDLENLSNIFCESFQKIMISGSQAILSELGLEYQQLPNSLAG